MLKARFNNNEELLKVLRTVESILSVNSVGNKLRFVKLANVNNKLQITAINPAMRLYYLMDVDDISGDTALYDYKTLSSLLNVINGTVTIEDGSIKSTKCSYKIPCEGAEGYPEDIVPEITNYIEVNTECFKIAVDNAGTATDKMTQSIMSGVYLNEGKLIGCDSKRVAVEKVKTEGSIEDIVLPKDFARELTRLPFGDSVNISIFGEKIIVNDSAIMFVCSKLADKYPKVEAVIPKNEKYKIQLKNEELTEALTLVAPIIDEGTKECYLEYENDKMLVYVNNGLESAKTSISIKSDAKEKVVVKFNIQFLLDMLKASGEDVTITTYSDNIGYKFTSNKEGFQYIMPLLD